MLIEKTAAVFSCIFPAHPHMDIPRPKLHWPVAQPITTSRLNNPFFPLPNNVSSRTYLPTYVHTHALAVSACSLSPGRIYLHTQVCELHKVTSMRNLVSRPSVNDALGKTARFEDVLVTHVLRGQLH